MSEFFTKRVPLECVRLMSGVDGVIKMVWEILGEKDLPSRQKMAALSLLLKCFGTRRELLPKVLSAKESTERREKMFAQMEEALDAEIEKRGL